MPRLTSIYLTLLVLTACDSNRIPRYIEFDEKGRPNLNRELIFSDLDPLRSPCEVDSDCQLDTLSARTCNGSTEGAYLISKQAEFENFKADVGEAVYFRNEKEGFPMCANAKRIFTNTTPAKSVCDGICKAQQSYSANFESRVYLRVPSPTTTLEIFDPLMYRTEGHTELNLESNELAFVVSLGSEKIFGKVLRSDAESALDKAAEVDICERSSFPEVLPSYQRITLFCGFSLRINDVISNDELWIQLCNESDRESLIAASLQFRDLILDALEPPPQTVTDALNAFDTWDPAEDGNGICGIRVLED